MISPQVPIESIKTKHSFQTHRRSNLRDKQMKVRENEANQDGDEIKCENRLKLKDNNKENLKIIYENENMNKTSIEEGPEGKHNISNSVFKEKNDLRVKVHRRFGLKNKKKTKE
jgi:hypothetical protein